MAKSMECWSSGRVPPTRFAALTSFEHFKQTYSGFELMDRRKFAVLRTHVWRGIYPAPHEVDWLLLQASQVLQLTELTEFCERILFLNMETKDTFTYLVRADRCGAKLLKSSILKYLACFRDYFDRSVGWEPLLNYPHLIEEYQREANDPLFAAHYNKHLASLRPNMRKNPPGRFFPAPSESKRNATVKNDAQQPSSSSDFSGHRGSTSAAPVSRRRKESTGNYLKGIFINGHDYVKISDYRRRFVASAIANKDALPKNLEEVFPIVPNPRRSPKVSTPGPSKKTIHTSGFPQPETPQQTTFSWVNPNRVENQRSGSGKACDSVGVIFKKMVRPNPDAGISNGCKIPGRTVRFADSGSSPYSVVCSNNSTQGSSKADDFCYATYQQQKAEVFAMVQALNSGQSNRVNPANRLRFSLRNGCATNVLHPLHIDPPACHPRMNEVSSSVPVLMVAPTAVQTNGRGGRECAWPRPDSNSLMQTSSNGGQSFVYPEYFAVASGNQNGASSSTYVHQQHDSASASPYYIQNLDIPTANSNCEPQPNATDLPNRVAIQYDITIASEEFTSIYNIGQQIQFDSDQTYELESITPSITDPNLLDADEESQRLFIEAIEQIHNSVFPLSTQPEPNQSA